jgi:hypothetical protein
MFSIAIIRINCGECPKSDILKPCYCDIGWKRIDRIKKYFSSIEFNDDFGE